MAPTSCGCWRRQGGFCSKESNKGLDHILLERDEATHDLRVRASDGSVLYDAVCAMTGDVPFRCVTPVSKVLHGLRAIGAGKIVVSTLPQAIVFSHPDRWMYIQRVSTTKYPNITALLKECVVTGQVDVDAAKIHRIVDMMAALSTEEFAPIRLSVVEARLVAQLTDKSKADFSYTFDIDAGAPPFDTLFSGRLLSRSLKVLGDVGRIQFACVKSDMYRLVCTERPDVAVYQMSMRG